MSVRVSLLPSLAVLTVFLTAGCATQGPQPVEEMTRARTVIEQADKSDAQRYAAADLQRAHDEFSSAQQANNDKKYDTARRYAESAAVDADVATARASAAEAQHAAEEIQRSNETLRQESLHGAATPNSN